MSATTIERDPVFTSIIPSHGSLSASAASKYLRGTMVGKSTLGRAVVPVAATSTPIQGVASATYDNTAGANDAMVVEVDYGVFGFLINGGTPTPGDTVYALDNQTVTLTKSTNSFAGICTEVRTLRGATYAFVHVNPFIQGTAQSAG